MEFKKQKRCMGCMGLLDWNGSCSHCGFDKEQYTSDPHYLPLGTLLKNGDYMVGKILGEGGFGITYIGFDQNLLSRIAIKEYYPVGFAGRNTSNSDYTVRGYSGELQKVYQKGLAAFLEEGRILAQFGGLEGIVNVRNLFEENGTAYIIMEYVSGISVRHYLQKHNKIDPEIVLGMMEQPIRALQAVHEKCLVHRDVSADNFIIGQDGKLTLIDFGAARYSNVLDHKTRTTICKQGFSAIEQYSAEGKQGPWTDIYGICATMYYMMTGMIPQNATERAVDDELIPLEKMPEISLDTEKKLVIMKGMAVKRKERLQNMEILYYSIYGTSLAHGTEKQELFPKEYPLPVAKETEIPPQTIGSPTGLLREMLQNTARQKKSEKRKKRIGKFAAGILIMSLPVFLFLNLTGYARFEDNSRIKPENGASPLRTVSQNPASSPALSTASAVSPVPSESVKETSLPKEEIQTVKMPEVAGNKKTTAMAKIEKTGLKCKVVKKYSNSIEKGRVIRASVSAGDSVKKGKVITLFISKGKKPIIPKATPKPATVTEKPKTVTTYPPVPQQTSPSKKPKKDDDFAGDLDDIIN